MESVGDADAPLGRWPCVAARRSAAAGPTRLLVRGRRRSRASPRGAARRRRRLRRSELGRPRRWSQDVTRVLTWCVIVASLSSVVGRAAQAQAAERPMTAAELPARLAPATRQLIVPLGDSLRAVGLPDAPLYAKAAEGVLKGAADARILVVL